MRECRQLERREVAVAHPSLARRGERGKIEAIDQPRPPVAAAHGDGDLDGRIFRHPGDSGEALVIRAGEALPTHLARGIDHHAMAEFGEPRRGAVDRLRLGREPCRSEQPDAVTALAHWTTFVLRTPVFALVGGPERSC